ncbi:MAG TPA: carbonic anhydrase [Acidimicrobiia bacterium]|jgi:carbonic anhydrase
MSVIDELVESNRAYADRFDKGGLSHEPARRVALLVCMDCRLDPARMLGLEEGDAHVIRNAGGVVTEDAIRSLVVSQRLLGTNEIMLIHHTRCGMLGLSDDDVKAGIEADTGVRPSFSFAGFDDLDGDVRESIARVKASPFLPDTSGVRGFVYEVESGRLREVV